MKKKKNKIKRNNRQKGSSLIKATFQGVASYATQVFTSPLAAPVISMVTSQLCDIADRQFSPLEAGRAKLGITIAVNKINERLNDGENLRQDGFFTESDNNEISKVRGRTKADKLFESMILTVKNDSEERKAEYIGRLFANLCFNENVDKIHVNSFIKMAGNLSYNDLCYLYIFRNESFFEFPDVRDITNFSSIIAKTEIFELMKLGFIASKKEEMQPSWFGGIDIRRLQVQGYGFSLYELMELQDMPFLDAYEVMKPLEIKFKIPLIQNMIEEYYSLASSSELSKAESEDVVLKGAYIEYLIRNAVRNAEERVKEKRMNKRSDK